MSVKTKKILFASAIIAACIAVIVTVLVLTLSGSEGGHILIEAVEGGEQGSQSVLGELDIRLHRERLETLTLGKDGLPVKAVDERNADFSKSNKNIFGIDENILIGPDCYFTADMAITNLKPYAFEYWLEITPEKGDNLLVDQLELVVKIDGEVFIERTLRDGLVTQPFPKVPRSQTAKFTVTLKYLDMKGNDMTKNTTLAFDMVVHARLTQF